MFNTIKLTGKQVSAALPLVRAAFPEYKGRRVRVEVSRKDIDMSSYWDEGRRSYFAGVELSTGRVLFVPENGGLGQARAIKHSPVPGVAVIEKVRDGGQETIYIWLHPADTGCKLLAAA